MKIAVTGAFSYSGKYITRRLLSRGEQVITLTNHPHRPDPFDGKVGTHPLDFGNEAEMIDTLRGTDVLVNTYWIRFDRGHNTQARAVENTRILMECATRAGVKRIVHISITNPSEASHLPYFQGKAANEKAVIESGMGYAILRPTVLFGREDILINNIAWLLRNFPFFGLPGDGSCRLSPVFVDDLAGLAVDSIYRRENYIWDAVGPDEFTFREMVELIGKMTGARRLLVSLHPRLALFAAQFLSLFVRDIMLTPEEIDGLMANLLTSDKPPRCKTGLGKWLEENRETVGVHYASELQRHF